MKARLIVFVIGIVTAILWVITVNPGLVFED
jgi:hypothetical protein